MTPTPETRVVPVEPTKDMIVAIRDGCPHFIMADTARLIYRNVLAAAPAAPATEPVDGLQAAIRFVEQRLEEYVRKCGSYDPSTGQTEFPDDGEYAGELEEIIDGLQGLRTAPPAAEEG